MGRIAVYDCRGGLQEKHTLRMLRRVLNQETPADREARWAQVVARLRDAAPEPVPFPVGRRPRRRTMDPFSPWDGGDGGDGGGPYNGGEPMPAPAADDLEDDGYELMAA